MTTIETDSRQLLTPAARETAVRAFLLVASRECLPPWWPREHRLREYDLGALATWLRESARALAGDEALVFQHAADACERAAETGRTAHAATATSLRLATK